MGEGWKAGSKGLKAGLRHAAVDRPDFAHDWRGRPSLLSMVGSMRPGAWPIRRSALCYGQTAAPDAAASIVRAEAGSCLPAQQVDPQQGLGRTDRSTPSRRHLGIGLSFQCDNRGVLHDIHRPARSFPLS